MGNIRDSDVYGMALHTIEHLFGTFGRHVYAGTLEGKLVHYNLGERHYAPAEMRSKLTQLCCEPDSVVWASRGDLEEDKDFVAQIKDATKRNYGW